MKCPNCPGSELQGEMTRQGVEVDRCENCKGVWLDRGELFLFTRDPEAVTDTLKTAMAVRTPTTKLSPRTGTRLQEIDYAGEARIDYCPESGGLWIEADELVALLDRDTLLKLEYDRPARTAGLAATGAGLLALPNLFLRSTLTLVGLYAGVGLVLIVAVDFVGADVEWGVGGALLVITLQFLIGPFIMDLSLRWLYRMRWLTPGEVPAHLRHFMERVCGEKNVSVPRIGLIDDGAPQAFTYGHTPGNARVVISRGLMELLDEDEVEAVVAHEIGHAVHWDMFLMTVAQMVPLLLYYVYRTMVRSARSGENKKGNVTGLIAVASYVLYIVSEYVVLWFSRTREYHADRFSGEVTGDPSALSSALAKIAYGLAGQEPATAEDGEKKERKRNVGLEAVGALGIFDARAASSMAIAGYSEAAAGSGAVNKANLRGAMRWDLWNPWAKWFELNSTHPLVANRLRHLSNQAVHMGRKPYIVFDEARPESYWDEFFDDLGIYLLPVAALILAPLAVGVVLGFGGAEGEMVGAALAAFGAALLVRFAFSYRGDFFPDMSVAALLKRVKVSAVRPVPCTLGGTIIGRGVPGYIFSEDFVMRDDTGIIFLDYRQPLGLWELFFGLLKAGSYTDREVVVEGWYRRSPVPYVEIRRITSDNATSRSRLLFFYRLTAIALIGAGILVALMPDAVWAWFAEHCNFYYISFECS